MKTDLYQPVTKTKTLLKSNKDKNTAVVEKKPNGGRKEQPVPHLLVAAPCMCGEPLLERETVR